MVVEERRGEELHAFEMWTWRRMETISWKDSITKEDVLGRVGEKTRVLNIIKGRNRNWIGTLDGRGW